MKIEIQQIETDIYLFAILIYIFSISFFTLTF